MGQCVSRPRSAPSSEPITTTDVPLAPTNVDPVRNSSHEVYVMQRYRRCIHEILETALLLPLLIDDIEKLHDDGQDMNKGIMKARNAIDKLSEGYSDFFKESESDSNEDVIKRKRLPQQEYLNLEVLKDKIEALGHKDVPAFDDARSRARQQVEIAKKMSEDVPLPDETPVNLPNDVQSSQARDSAV